MLNCHIQSLFITTNACWLLKSICMKGSFWSLSLHFSLVRLFVYISFERPCLVQDKVKLFSTTDKLVGPFYIHVLFSLYLVSYFSLVFSLSLSLFSLSLSLSLSHSLLCTNKTVTTTLDTLHRQQDIVFPVLWSRHHMVRCSCSTSIKTVNS